MIRSQLLNTFHNLEHYFLEKNEKLDITENCYVVNQIHSNFIIEVKKDSQKLQNADGLISNKKIFLGVKTADCLPILFFEPQKKYIAAVHAGWKGLYKEIISKTIKVFKGYGSKVANIRVAIGPHIRSCSYKVDSTRIRLFHKKYKDACIRRRNWYLELSNVAIKQLSAEGITTNHIDDLGICTYCDSRFPSFRREGNSAGRMYSIIGLI